MEIEKHAQRSDARRNHALLLNAAAGVFAAEGPDAALEHVARAAGVGIGTLYRHFPTREALFVEAYRHEVAQWCEAASELLATLPADLALREWMDRFVAHVATKRSLATGLRTATAPDSPVFAALSLLLDAGHAAGTIRDDYDVPDVLRAMSGIWSSGDPKDPGWHDQVGRLLDLLMDGLRFIPRK